MVEPKFSFRESSLKKRLHSETDHNPESNQQNPAKKPKLDDQVDACPDDLQIESQEKTLSELVAQNPKFFADIASKDYKQGPHFQKLMKNQMFGNRFQSYADQRESYRDPRLALMLAEFQSKRKGRCDLFEDKRVLDIGCHTGTLALQIAAQCNPKILIGLDIDSRLIKNAIDNIHHAINSESTADLVQQTLDGELMEVDEGRCAKLNELLSKVKQMPKSLQLALQAETEFLRQQSSTAQPTQKKKLGVSKMKEKLYQKLNYRTENYIETADVKKVLKEQFDTILCMSTIKWVHLCFGDVGVKALFLKAYAQLQDGGYFVFEQQPWKSYKKSKHHKAEFKEAVRGDGIKMRPNMFKAYLKHVGFTLVQTLIDPDQGCDKTIYVFKK